MSRHIRLVTSVVVATTLAGFIAAPVVTQDHQGLVTISANATIRPTDFQESEARVGRMIRDGELRLIAVHDDRQLADRQHEAFGQYFRGVRVYGGQVSRQTAQGVTVSIFGAIYTGIDLDPSPTLAVGEVGLMIEQRFGARLFQDSSELTILPTLDGGYALAYRMLLSDATTYFLDAHSGDVLLEIDEKQDQSAIGSGTGALGDVKKVSATQVSGRFETRDQLRPGEILTLNTRGNERALDRLLDGQSFPLDTAIDTDNVWTHPGVVDAHVHMGWTVDYFFKRHGWSGLDAFSGPITGIVNDQSVLPNNAFFIRPPFGPAGRGAVAFGATSSGNPVTTLDIVGHELMHGVTYFSVSRRTGSGLLPTFLTELGPNTVSIGGRSFACPTTILVFADGSSLPFFCSGGQYVLALDHGGAVNEAFADLFGTSAEFFFQAPGTGLLRADYLIGEDIPELGSRSLINPASLHVDTTRAVRYPDHYSGRLRFALLALPSGALAISPVVILGNEGFVLVGSDDGGVHWNSTILSHAFYLAIEGGRNATSGLTVSGVGSANRDQIEQVFFRAMTELMPSAVSMPLTAAVICQAAVDLFGTSSTVAQAVDEALLAVGL